MPEVWHLVTQVDSKRATTSDESEDSPFLTIQDLCKTYGGVTAADITRLEARRGQRFADIGVGSRGVSRSLVRSAYLCWVYKVRPSRVMIAAM